MGTLTQLGYLTFLIQSSNLVIGSKKQFTRAMSQHISRPSQNPLRVCSGFSSREICYTKTCSNSGPRNQFLKPLAALVTETDLEVAEVPEVKDLEVSVQSTSMVVPLEENVRRAMFLSNIDQAVNTFLGGTVFFTPNPKFPADVITRKLEAAFTRILVHYDFLAGRLRWNPQQGRLEIDCNSAGAGLVIASSKLSMADIGDLVCPNPAFQQLLTINWDKNLSSDDQPIFTMQVTSFKCGGVAVGFAMNHATFDGISFQFFLQNLASLAAGNPHLPFPPNNNRHLLQARSPPQVTHAHHEMISLGLKTSPGDDHNIASILSSPIESDNLQPKILHLSDNDIKNLKKKASNVLGNSSSFKSGIMTSFNVVTAHVWRCMALTKYNGEHKEKESFILFPVNVRSKLRPRLPTLYTGNAILYGYGKATYEEVEAKPFSYLVERVAEGEKRVNDEYIRSNIDWSELHNGYTQGDVIVTPWWKLGLDSIEFPWGKPKCVCPSLHQFSKLVILLQDIREVKNKGLNVFVSLPPKELEEFQALFYQFLS